MNDKRLGRQTVALAHPPSVLSFSNIGGKFEGQGPLADFFDEISNDSFFGEKTWEKAESAMQKTVLQRALEKAELTPEDLDYILAGDLLNQCIGSSFGLRDFRVPFYGLYGACSTMGESLSLASLLIDGGYADRAAALTSSHFCTAERQYRTPLEYGSQRTPTAQWTVTAAGAVLLSREGPGPYLTHVTPGRVVDKGVTDTNNMGAAMAPAAFRSPAVTGWPWPLYPTIIRARRAFRSVRSSARHSTAMTSVATVMSKPSSRGTPFPLPPRPQRMYRSWRSFMSTQRFQVIRRTSMSRILPC